MSSQAQGGPRWRNGPFQGRERDPDTPSPGPPPGHARSKSSIMQPLSPGAPLGHVRNQSVSDLRSGGLGRSDSRRNGSIRGGASPGTFAPQFIKPENMDGANGDVRVVEGENDLSGKRYVWMRDDEKAFVKGWVVEELPDGMLRAQCEDGSVSNCKQHVRDEILTFFTATRGSSRQCRQGQSSQIRQSRRYGRTHTLE